MADKTVHRSLHLATPHLKGPDVSALQGSINKQFAHLKIDRSVTVDGELGAQTFAAAKQVAICLGVVGPGHKKLKRNTVSMGTQALIRGRKRTTAETIAGTARAPYRAALRKRYAKAPGEVAIERALKYVGTTELPYGSNWGPKVSKFILYTGYTGPVYWCGCFACWTICKLGGAKIPNRIRMGYAPYITEDAKAGANGFTAVPVQDAQPGDIGCLWGGEHVVTVREKYSGGGLVKTIEGNTSSADGSQSNGGGVFLKERSIGDFDSGIVARPSF